MSELEFSERGKAGNGGGGDAGRGGRMDEDENAETMADLWRWRSCARRKRGGVRGRRMMIPSVSVGVSVQASIDFD